MARDSGEEGTKGVGEESRWGCRRLLRWLVLVAGLFLGKLVQDVESFLNLSTQTLRRIKQAQEFFSDEITGCVEEAIRPAVDRGT